MGPRKQFVLYRILGNDLPPRHGTGQTIRNLTFILDHEPHLEGCEKRWIVNRIEARGIEARITNLLEEREQQYLRIPFVEAEYLSCHFDFEGLPPEYYFYRQEFRALEPHDQSNLMNWCYRRKNLYLMNVNGARNAALREGRTLADWVLPFDGGCFFTAAAWASVLEAAARARSAKYLIVPMARMIDNECLLDPAYRPQDMDEPQIAFRRDARETFDETLQYGNMPKTALLRRLGVPGRWDVAKRLRWDNINDTPSPERGQYLEGGWVARLASGNPTADGDFPTRNQSRRASIRHACVAAEVRIVLRTRPADRLCFFDQMILDRERRAWLEGEPALVDLVSSMLLLAERALESGMLSVTDKPTMAPSGDPHDYWSMAPESRPDMASSDAASDRSDRSKVQQLLDDVTVLALCWFFTREDRFARHAADLLRAWFVAPATRMNPHLRYARAGVGNEEDRTGAGIVETRDVAHALDAIRLVLRSGALTAEDTAALRAWFRAFYDWLRTSEQGMAAAASANHVGTCYDLQIVALAAFLDERVNFCQRVTMSRMRIAGQIRPDGVQPNERSGEHPLHCELFNLQLWANLARLAAVDLWNFHMSDGRSLALALAMVAARVNSVAANEPLSRSAGLRLEVLQAFTDNRGHAASARRPKYRLPACMPSYCAVAPFWQLGLPQELLNVGDPVPALKLAGLRDLTTTTSLAATGDRPLVLFFGSYTCPVFRRLAPELQKMYEDFNRQARFFIVYLAEQHPVGEPEISPNAREDIRVAQHANLRERQAAAQNCMEKLGLNIPVLLDGMDEAALDAFSAAPVRICVVNAQGHIHYRGGRGPYGVHVSEARAVLVELLNAKARAES